MRFSTVISVLACGAMAFAAALAPGVLVGRSSTGVSDAVSVLNHKCDSILPLFDTCNDAQCTDTIVLKLVAEVDVATAACVNLNEGISAPLVQGVAGVVSKIILKLNSHKLSCGGKCGDFSVYAKIDLCISLWLQQLGVCVSGILVSVAALLLDVVLVLQGLSLSLILKVCLFIQV
ncbi:hypothetical protein BJ322DRAFT_811805 [Thelephora terrestris]|uniref:Uncharacterized protein n=1 Tax=Thelephora terrestris TaxID=56493 RepID=A0A9P6HEH5_9AGAM|nr:hypothetical protein BJ322DRAFT_811805 [Thelephora terrestris]